MYNFAVQERKTIDLAQGRVDASRLFGVQTIYIDAFAGRAPGSVLAKHYVDLSPTKLKQVYEQAGLRVLGQPNNDRLIVGSHDLTSTARYLNFPYVALTGSE